MRQLSFGRQIGDLSGSRLVGLAGEAGSAYQPRQLAVNTLLDLRAATLNQYRQNRHNQNSSNDANNHGTVHKNPLSSFNQTACFAPVERDTNGTKCQLQVPWSADQRTG
jgi:hypothetical protein